MALDAQVNKSSPTNFELVFPKLPTETNLAATNELSLNIFQTILPSLTLDGEEQNFQGAKRLSASGSLTYEPWNVNFIVDSSFYNWYALYKWIAYIHNGRTKYAEKPSNYAVDATLMLKDNFRNEIFRIKFIGVWITMLGEMNLSYREGEQKMECNATFNYDYFDISEVLS
jgi:hypothetical protein